MPFLGARLVLIFKIYSCLYIECIIIVKNVTMILLGWRIPEFVFKKCQVNDLAESIAMTQSYIDMIGKWSEEHSDEVSCGINIREV